MQDFEVIVNCTSRGRSLETLVDDLSKYMLPIANKPLLGYLLELFQSKYQAARVTVIVNPSNRQEIEKYVKETFKGPSKKISVYFPAKCYEADHSNPDLVDFLPEMWAEGLIKVRLKVI